MVAPLVLLCMRSLARLTRRLAGRWCAVPIADPYLPPPWADGGKRGPRRRYAWLLTDQATWRDLLWVTVDGCVGWILAVLPAVLLVLGVLAVIAPYASLQVRVLAIAGAAFGLWAAPSLMRGYGFFARSMLAPTGQAELTLRVRHLDQTRTEALHTGAAEIRRIERDLHDGAQARLVAMGMTLDAAGQIIDTNPDAARALLWEARDSSVKALAELRALVRGIHPPVLADRGLADAIQALTLDTPLRIHLASDLDGRAARAGRVGRLLHGERTAGQRVQARRGARDLDRHPAHRRDAADRGDRQRARQRRPRPRQRAARDRAAAGPVRRRPGHQQPARRPDRGNHGDPVRVVIAEDLFLLRDGLTRMLQAHGLEITAAVDNGPDLLAAVAKDQPDVAIVDVRLPPTFTDEGIRAALAARREVPGLPVLVLSQYVEQLYARELLASGTGGIGYLLKDRVFDSAQFVDAVRRVAAGGTAMDPEVIARLLARNTGNASVAALSRREREVLALMAEGRSNAAIAQRMVITERAVAKHTASIFLKLDLQPSDDDNRRVLAVLAYLEG